MSKRCCAHCDERWVEHPAKICDSCICDVDIVECLQCGEEMELVFTLGGNRDRTICPLCVSKAKAAQATRKRQRANELDAEAKLLAIAVIQKKE